VKKAHLWFGCAGMALLLAACASGGGGATKPVPSNEIVIGVAGPMTGDLAAFGEQIRRGAQQAVADLNTGGGVLGKQVRLLIGDDQCDPKRAVRVANDLVKQGVVFVDGHFCSGSSIPASQVYVDAHVLQMTPASTNPMLTEWMADEGIQTVLRTCGRDDRQGAFAGTWLAKTYAGKQVAILDDESRYGVLAAGEAHRTMQAGGLPPTLRETFRSGEKDFAPLIEKLKSVGIDAVYVGAYHDDVGPLVRQARAMGFDGAFAAGDALNTSEFWSIAGSAAEGVRFVDAPYLGNLQTAKPVVAKFRAQGYEPEGYTLNAYAAVQAWAAAADRAQSTDAEKVGSALRASSIPTAIGDLRWDAKGDLVEPNYAWFVWRAGSYIQEP
jgi:branched-chain amino acid transport system substrate-binding protein